jgi:hypothetical protein
MNDRSFGDRHGPTPDEMRHLFTVRPVDPELERAATERAVQAAEDSARAAAWIDAHSGPEMNPVKLRERLERAHTEAATLSGQIGDLKRELAEARTTNQRLNARAQRLESELAAYRRAVAQWEINDRGTYVPLRTIAAIAKAAGLNIDNPHWIMHYQRVEQAEAAIARTRAACDQLRRASTLADGQPHTDRERGILQAVDRITRALDEPAAGPAATEATGHHYLSTGCFHGDHDYCSNIDGRAGLKKPAQCKFCAAPCVCSCHREQPAEPAATRATDDAGPTVAEAAAHDRRWPLEKAGE